MVNWMKCCQSKMIISPNEITWLHNNKIRLTNLFFVSFSVNNPISSCCCLLLSQLSFMMLMLPLMLLCFTPTDLLHTISEHIEAREEGLDVFRGRDVDDIIMGTRTGGKIWTFKEFVRSLFSLFLFPLHPALGKYTLVSLYTQIQWFRWSNHSCLMFSMFHYQVKCGPNMNINQCIVWYYTTSEYWALHSSQNSSCVCWLDQ